MNKNWLKNGQKPVIIAGPCSAETEEQLIETVQQIQAETNIDFIRAGIWKPRTRPGTFEGVGEEGLQWLVNAKKETGIPVTVEVANTKHVEACLKMGIDVLWLGARTTVNPFAVQEIADALKGVDIPVMVKNPINPDLSLWMGAIERLEKVGIDKIAAIHRGFSNYGEKKYRNSPIWQIPIDFKIKLPKIPMIVDPSHICGNRTLLAAVAQKAMDLDYDGVMIETHRSPDDAWSDAKQQVTPKVLKSILENLVIRTSKSKDIHDLDDLRANITQIDEQIWNLLSERMGIAKNIGQYKKDNGITILQKDRWAEIVQKANEKAAELGLSNKFMSTVMKAVHEESIEIQNGVMNE